MKHCRGSGARSVGVSAILSMLAACGTSPTPNDGSTSGLDAGDAGDAAANGDSADVSDAGDGGDAGFTGPPTAFWQLPRTGPNAFLLPWPSDLTLTAAGFADFTFVPDATRNALVNSYITALQRRIAGFSTVGATYFRFSTAIDPATLPTDPAATTAPGSSVQIVDLDHAERVPAQTLFRPNGARYWPAGTLAVAPALGFPLRPHTRYAVVVTTAVHPAAGGTYLRDADLTAVLASSGGDDAVMNARAAEGPALDALQGAGVARDAILSLAVFTTQDPTDAFFRAADHLLATAAPASVIDIAAGSSPAAYHVYTGHYGPSPIYQTGALPYSDPGTGDFTVDASGNPVIQGTTNITFALSVPTGAMPAQGWPVVIYAHGTGGDAQSFLQDGTAASLASQGLAVFSFDQIFNGDRAVGGSDESVAEAEFFNVNNVLAARTNNRQAALDLIQAGRLVRTMTVPASVAAGGQEVRFDASHVMFFGHSQGGLNGPLWLAAEDGAGAGVLSGSGGTLTVSITEKTEPINIPVIVGAALGSSAADVVPLHPVITLVQTALDVADPVNYGRYILREPRAGNAPKHVFQTQGFVDHYTPPDSIQSLAVAIGDQLTGPVLHDQASYTLTGAPIGMLPLRGNVAMGRATAVWQQFNSALGSDGHFVVFDIADARRRAAAFLASHVSDPMGIPTVPQ